MSGLGRKSEMANSQEISTPSLDKPRHSYKNWTRAFRLGSIQRYSDREIAKIRVTLLKNTWNNIF